MALNPPLTAAGVPLRVENEFFVLYRKDMECEVKIQNLGTYSANGKVYLTTCRIVFVNDKFSSQAFKAFDFPLAYLAKEKFEQPIFGSNYLAGEVAALYNLLPGKTQFKLWFKAGGCSLFLKLIVEILRQIRSNRSQGRMGPDQRWIDQVTRTQSQAYMDPNDPSVIYLNQPNIAQQEYNQAQWNIPQNYVAKGIPVQQGQGQPISGQPIQGQPQYQQPQYGQQQPYNQQQYGQQQYGQQQEYQQYQQPQQQYGQQQQQQYQQLPQYQQQFNQQPQQPYQQYDQQYGQPQQQLQQPQQQYNQQQPQYQGNVNYPPLDDYQQQVQQVPEQQPQQQQQQAQQPQQPQQPQNQPNAAYYYGFWGPQLQNNPQQNNNL